jgi:outer membrane protein assembly factor BamB
MFNHDPAHTSYSSSSVPANPVLVWTYPTPNITSVELDHNFVTSTPALAGGYLFISGANGGGFYCLNASTGTEIWNKNELGTETSGPAYDEGIVYVGNSLNFIAALNASTGTQIWNGASYENGSASNPTIANGVVYTQGYNAYALNASTGTKIWSYTNQEGFHSGASPAVSAGYVYIASNSYLYALNASTGKQIWIDPIAHSEVFHSSPTVSGDMVYIGSEDHNLYAFNAFTGAHVWNYTTSLPVSSSPAIAYGMVYVGSWDKNIYAFNESTGDKIWNFTTGEAVFSSPAVADGVVYSSSDDRYLYALNATTGKLLWKYPTISPSDLYATYVNMLASPAVAYGNIYIGTNEGNVLAFGHPSPSPSTTPSDLELIAIATGLAIVILAVLFIVYRNRRKK